MTSMLHVQPARLALMLCLALSAAVCGSGVAHAEDSLVRPGKRNGAGKVRTPGHPRQPGKNRPAGPDEPDRPSGASPGEAEPDEDDPRRAAVLIERYRAALEARPDEQFALDRLIELYRQEHGTIEGLLSDYEQRIASEGRVFAPRMVLAEIYRRGGRIEEAMRLLREAAEIRPADPSPHLVMARAAREAGGAAGARAALDEALRLSRGADRQDVLRLLRELALGQDDLDAARRYHQDLVRASGDSLYVRLELAQDLARLDRHQDAVEELQAVLTQVSGDPRARVPVLRELAASQSALGQEPEALATLRTALGLTQPGSGERAELLEMMVDVYRRGDALRELVDLLEDERGGGGFERAELLGRLCDELAEAARAEQWYRQALRLDARHVDTRTRLIRLLVRQGRIEEATREYETLTRTAPGEPQFVTELAEMYLRLGERERALGLLARTGRSHPSDATLHSALLTLYGQWGEDELALEEARILARIDPRDETHLVELGERYFQAGDQERALATWRRIPTVTAERWHGLAVLGDVLADHEMADEAVALYEEALALRPDEAGLIRRMANLLERLRRWDEAVARWSRLIEVAPADDTSARREARTRIVTIWANERRLHGQLPDLRRRFSGRPPDLEAGRFLYEGLERLGQPRDALSVIRSVLLHRPGDVEALMALERCLVRDGDLAGAMDTVRRLLELEPRRARELYQRLSSYAMQLQRDDEALEYAARALELNPDDAQGRYRLAQLYRQQGDDGRAVTEYTRAIELDDRLFDAYLELAEVHEMHSEPQDAIRVYVRLLGKSPDDAMVLRAGRQARLLAIMDGTVDRLEHELLPLALAHTERVIYRRILVELYQDLTGSLIQVATSGDDDAAQGARTRLEALGQRSLQPLLDALLDADPDQQKAAITMLGHLGNASAAVPLVAYATGEGDRSLRVMALLSAGQVGDTRIVPDLVRVLDAPPVPEMQEVAAYGLARIASPDAITALLRHVEGPSSSVRTFACIGLGRDRQARHLDVLRRVFDRDSQTTPRRAAAWAMGQLGSDQATSHLAGSLPNAPPGARTAVAWALGAADDPDARRALAVALFDAGDEDLARTAAWALRRTGSGPLSSDPRPDEVPELPVQADAVLAGLMPMDPAGGSALAALARAGPELEAAIDHALGGRGVPSNARIAATLRALTGSRTGELRLPHIVTSEELAATDVRDALRPIETLVVRRATALLGHTEPEIRRRAALLLTRIGVEGGALPGLVAALESNDAGVRSITLDNLESCDDPSLTRPLLALLRDDRWLTRVRAVQALSRIPGDEIGRTLAEVAARDDSPAVRSEAVSALGSRGPNFQAALIESATNDDNALVRTAACRALAGESQLPPACDPPPDR
jgi:tetratricopeptide (TPR) repeat protein